MLDTLGKEQDRRSGVLPTFSFGAVNEKTQQALDGLSRAIDHVNALVLGKHEQVRLAFACLLAGGHLLLEDLPGTGKTILARALASSMSCEFRRVQFTSDLMPSDILGVSVYQPKHGEFELHPGPVFTNVLLADEINRASPRTQSALLEAMAEGQVSIDRTTLALPFPFMVLATQNPLDTAGTFALPDAQKDRFLFQISLGYPDKASELALMRGERRGDLLKAGGCAGLLSADAVLLLRQRVHQVKVSDATFEYIYALVQATREEKEFAAGLSPRACLALVEASQALAFLDGHAFVRPEDVQEAFLPLACHRIQTQAAGEKSEQRLRKLLNEVAIP